MKTTKGGKVMNPTDAYRKELRKKELKRNKERKKVREVGILKKDAQAFKVQIEKLEMMNISLSLGLTMCKVERGYYNQFEKCIPSGALPIIVINFVELLQRLKEFEDKMKEKGETPVMFSHLWPPRRRTTAEEDERAKHPKPEDSVYYHPTRNPTGAPPPGKPPMHKSSIVPLLLPHRLELEDTSVAVPPPPPPPFPDTSKLDLGDASDVPASLPLPPPPPMPPKPAKMNLGIPLPSHPGPSPPPPGSPSKEQVTVRPPLPPPPPLPQSVLPPLSGSNRNEGEKISLQSDDSTSKELAQVPTSVRVRREAAAPKAKPKPLHSAMTMAAKPVAPAIVKQESTSLNFGHILIVTDQIVALLTDKTIIK
ncbi:hypothetical protein Godav_005200 [Gossypium davidsonii]|uniref:Wbp11/ELF5/Saf1 N-terminal domain-containing protein n=1 Tax=Gossypium davidsonii TaxID=34287 RepID=A0A7J8TCT8_GOSDV|nr:hypothetical protein [Gossypium davidsonii]